MKVAYINQFLFDEARYVVRNLDNKPVNLVVNYKANSYSIEANGLDDPSFLQELSDIAADLLRRKHGVNMAERS